MQYTSRTLITHFCQPGTSSLPKTRGRRRWPSVQCVKHSGNADGRPIGSNVGLSTSARYRLAICQITQASFVSFGRAFPYHTSHGTWLARIHKQACMQRHQTLYDKAHLTLTQ